MNINKMVKESKEYIEVLYKHYQANPSPIRRAEFEIQLDQILFSSLKVYALGNTGMKAFMAWIDEFKVKYLNECDEMLETQCNAHIQDVKH